MISSFIAKWYGLCTLVYINMGYSKYHITCEFEYNSKRYVAYLCPYYELTELEMVLYKIEEFNYVVHLFSLEEGFKTFEMFPDENLHWTSNASPMLVNKEMTEIMSYVLSNALK